MVGRSPLDEWSASRRDFYLTTQSTRNRQTSMSPVGFEPTISVGEMPQTYVLDRTAIWIGMTFSMSLLLISFICELFEGHEKEILYSLRTKLQCHYMIFCSINKISDPFKNVDFTLVTTALVIVQSLRLTDQGRFDNWNCSFLQVK